MSEFSYTRHRFPPAIIPHAVWLCFRIALSHRDVEDLLAEHGIDVSHETVRGRALRFGRVYVQRLRQRRPRSSGRWHLDQVFVRIGGGIRYLRRAIDDEVLDIFMQARRDRNAAIKLIRKPLKRQGYLPDAIATDRLRAYGAALCDLGLAERHVTGGCANNRAEVSHRPNRHRERQHHGFGSPGSAQRFLATLAADYGHFNIQRQPISRRTLRAFRAEAFAGWCEVTTA